jgi:hypothetical protein
VIIKLIKFILVNTSKLSLCLFITILLQVIILLITYKAIWFILRRELKLITIIILILVITILVIVISLFKILMVCIIGLNLF